MHPPHSDPDPTHRGPFGLLVPRLGINKQAEVVSLFLGNKAGVVWRGVWREPRARWKRAREASMITSLPCREHLRTPRPDVSILHSLWCGKIPIKSSLSLPSQPAEGWPPACAGLVFCLRSTSPLMEEPQLLLHCQRSGGSSRHTQRLGSRQAPATQPPARREARPADPPPSPSASLLLPSSATACHSPLKSPLLILAHFSRLPYCNSIQATSSPGTSPASPPGFVNGGPLSWREPVPRMGDLCP